MKMTIVDYDKRIEVIENNTAVADTPKINGQLCALIISSNKNCEVRVNFAEIENIVLYHDLDFSGMKYLPLKLNTITKSGEKSLVFSSKWVLNNKIRITVSGSKGTAINITLRVIENAS